MKISRKWAMPNKNTFSIPPIKTFVEHYLSESTVSADPFAGHSRLATYNNDLNEQIEQEYSMEASLFLEKLSAENIVCDLVIFDPPYSPRQLSECYKNIGRKTTQEDTQSKSWRV